MKKLLLIGCVVLALGASAFTINHVSKAKKPGTDYFQYSGSDENNGTLISSGNWTYLSGGLPGTSPCSTGTNIVCVVNVPDASLPPGPSMEARFASYLSTVSGGAKNYVDANFNYQKP